MRVCVSFLDGLEDLVTEEQYNSIDNIMGYEMEQMVPYSQIDNFIGSSDRCMTIKSARIMTTNELSPPAPLQLPPFSSTSITTTRICATKRRHSCTSLKETCAEFIGKCNCGMKQHGQAAQV